MGASSSEPQRPLPALPVQHIVAMSPEGGPVGPASAGGVPVGSTRQAQAVRQPLTLCRDSLHLSPNGVVSFEVDAIVEGTVSLLSPATVSELSKATPAASEGETPKTMWPKITADAPGQPYTRRVARGAKQKLSFGNQGEALLPAQRNQRRPEPVGHDSGRRWPLILLLSPGPPGNWAYGSAAETPKDGSMLICCVVDEGTPKIAWQVIAWDKAAYVLKELYGISEARDALESETQGLCVVCLTDPKTTALLPCGHFCVCMDCGTSIRITPGRNRCPLCRGEVNDLMRMNITSDSIPDAAPTQAAADSKVALPAVGNLPPAGGYPAGTGSSAASTAPSATPEEMRAARLRMLEGTNATNDIDGIISGSGKPGGSSSAEPVASKESSSSSSLSTFGQRRLGMELKQCAASKQELLEQHGVEVSMVDGDNMRVWTARIHSSSVDPSTEFGKQLKSWAIDYVLFEIWIPDGFPAEPPKVRVMSPIFKSGSFWVHDHGAMCMETLTKQGWSPAMTLPKLVVQIKVMMSQGKGSITGTGSQSMGSRESAWATFDKIEAAHGDWKHFSDR